MSSSKSKARARTKAGDHYKRSPAQTSAGFVKGYDPRRNLAGRPKVGESLAEKIRDAMAEPVREDGYTKLDALIDEAMSRAKAGNYVLLQMLWDRGYGKVSERVELAQADKPDLSKLTDDEIAELTRILEKAK